MGRSGDPRKANRQWKSSGLSVRVDDRYGADPQDPGPGVHLWTVITMFKVTPSADDFFLDQENLITIQGPGCYKCERPFSPALDQTPCPGSMK